MGDATIDDAPMQLIDTLFVIAVVVISAVVHEVMHGVAANRLGDPTARLAGRLTLNPFQHLDLFGSVLLPGVLAITNSPVLFGWAKPVPYNPFNLKPGRFSEAFVAGAGPFANVVIAVCAALAIRSTLFSGSEDILFVVVVINVMMAIFNMIPLPPLDGSKVLPALLPRTVGHEYDRWRMRAEYNPFFSMGMVFVVVLFLGSIFGSAVFAIAHLLAGM